MSTSPLGGAGGVDFSAFLATGDIQTLIQMVQSERVRLLDAQLVDQVKAVQARNDQIAKLNDVLGKLNSFATTIKGTDPGSKPDPWNAGTVKQYEIPLNDAIIDAGITDLGFSSGTGQKTPDPGYTGEKGNAGGQIIGPATNIVNGGITKSQVDAAITKIKGLIDAESNNQQMDMLRLQSLTNKKNESIEILTNTQKKHNESASGIIRNI